MPIDLSYSPKVLALVEQTATFTKDVVLEIDIASTRALLIRACWELDQGGRASTATSIAKTHASEAIFRIVDRSTQMCGGLGVSEDLPLTRLAREVRPFRIYAGPSEAHRWAIAKCVIGAAKHVAQEQK